MTLRRAAEMAGMAERCDFVEQTSAEGDEGRIRPDMIIRLPGGRNIVVDAKTPLSAYIDSVEAENEAEKSECLKNHARQVSGHILKLSQKNYWKQFNPTPEFVVLFIPGENFFSAALSEQPDLMETASEKNIVLATPSTLISLLKTVAHAWREDSVARSAKTVMEMGRELCDRIHTVASYMNRLGKDIEKCADTYNQAAASLERRVFVTARKFHSLGLSSSEAKDPLERIDIKARLLDETDQNESAEA
jgi:DNA recombination protein RmuC